MIQSKRNDYAYLIFSSSVFAPPRSIDFTSPARVLFLVSWSALSARAVLGHRASVRTRDPRNRASQRRPATGAEAGDFRVL